LHQWRQESFGVFITPAWVGSHLSEQQQLTLLDAAKSLSLATGHAEEN